MKVNRLAGTGHDDTDCRSRPQTLADHCVGTDHHGSAAGVQMADDSRNYARDGPMNLHGFPVESEFGRHIQVVSPGVV